MSDDSHPVQRTMAAIRRSHWPGWIWAVPIGAVAVVIWLIVRSLNTGGTDVTVMFDSAAGVSDQTDVTFRGVSVGKVSEVELSKDQHHVVMTIRIDDDVAGDLRSGSRFYMENASPNLADLSSLKSVISGPSIVLVPGAGKKTDHFRGVIGKPPELLAEPVRYLVNFTGDVGALQPGDSVQMRGFDVGQVVSVGLHTDVKTGVITAPVVMALDAARFHIAGGRGSPAAQLTALLRKLVAQGLRAQLTQSPPLIGGRQVTLNILPKASPASLVTGGAYPEIPTSKGAGLDALMTKLGQLPISKIGSNVRAITEQVKSLTASPRIRQSLVHLNNTLAELDKVVHQAGPQVTPAIVDLRDAAAEIDATAGEIKTAAAQARKMVGAGPAAPDGNLQKMLQELTKAARSIRTLADYLDRHPEALIHGR